MKIMIVGGAGYIGSHVVKLLGGKGFKILVYDNLSKGHKEAILYGTFIKGDLNNLKLLDKTIKKFKPDAVMHFASFIEVGESVKDPIKYYKNNFVNTLNLVEIMLKNKVNKLIVSSTAAVYGLPNKIPITENQEIKPINPYGYSKSFIEQLLKDLSVSDNLKYISLRYFNACGADPEGKIGENHDPESHLIPLVLKAAKGQRNSIKIYGTDYKTKDGTCIRDYIHVNDLAEAHLLALNYLIKTNKCDVFNLGYGHGYSVKEVITIAKEITKINFKVEKSYRREGDPDSLIADNTKIKKILKWKPKHDNLKFIIKTAWNWEKKK